MASYKEEIRKALDEYGVRRGPKGYTYLSKGLLMLLEGEVSAEPLHVWTLYEAVAEQNSTTPSCVEQTIRNALRARAKKEHDLHVTNKDFILRVYDDIKQKEDIQ